MSSYELQRYSFLSKWRIPKSGYFELLLNLCRMIVLWRNEQYHCYSLSMTSPFINKRVKPPGVLA